MKIFVTHEIMNPEACGDDGGERIFKPDSEWNLIFSGLMNELRLRVVDVQHISERSDTFDEWNW